MSAGLNYNSVAGAALELYNFICLSREPNENYPFDPQLALWRHLIVPGFGSVTGAGTLNLITYTVPSNVSWVILHTAIQSQPDANSDANLGAAPLNYGDFRSETSLNPYGDFATTTLAQWIIVQSSTGITPNVRSFGLQGQQTLLVVPGDSQARLTIDPNLGAGHGPITFFGAAWGFLIPPGVAGRLQGLSTNWGIG